MRVVIQRAGMASVNINREEDRSIGKGLVVLLGIGQDDEEEDVHWLVKKIVDLRIFSDQEGKMNLSVKDVDGEILLISQFTLHAMTKKGNRPSFINAAKPDIAIPLYDLFGKELMANGIKVSTGEFGADMKVSLVNDGPVTILIDSRNRE